MKNMETWKDIPGFEGLYQVSNLGIVRSVDRVKDQSDGKKRFFPGKVIKQFIDDSGYPRICIYTKEARPTKQKVHRLVALAFIPNPENKPFVNHIDHNRKNSSAENLEWCTTLENVRHAIKSGRWFKQPSGFESHNGKSVIAINIKTGEQTKFGSQKDAARQLGIWQTHVNGCITGRCKTTKGYTFLSCA